MEKSLEARWREKEQDIFQFRALLASRSNIFVHGPNGAGKTTFVHDCASVESRRDKTSIVFVDCIEYYSERLIAICISQ